MKRDHSSITRRSFAVGVIALTIPGGPSRISSQVLSPDVRKRLEALAGISPLPFDLYRNLTSVLSDNDSRALAGSSVLSAGQRSRLLMALYTGIYNSGDDDAEDHRIGFSSALMWHAIRESNNVISYCGGMPGFWSQPPATG